MNAPPREPTPPEVKTTRHDVVLCDWCEDKHFRSYPELPGHSCYRLECECWCNHL